MRLIVGPSVRGGRFPFLGARALGTRAEPVFVPGRKLIGPLVRGRLAPFLGTRALGARAVPVEK